MFQGSPDDPGPPCHLLVSLHGVELPFGSTFETFYLSAAFGKKRVTRLLETRLKAHVAPSQIRLERNQKVPGRPGVVGTTMKPSVFSSGVSQKKLRELEGGFPKVELHASCKTRQL
jgi:hypothetical protein